MSYIEETSASVKESPINIGQGTCHLPSDLSLNAKEPSTGSVQVTTSPVPARRTAFWLVFLVVCVSIFLSVLDLTVVGTALPTIVADLNGTSFAWIGSAYTLTAAAWLPLSGALANAFGRRPLMLFSLVFFALGSLICGEANNMTMMIAGRAVQGIGGGGIISSTEILIADLVPLRERGLFMSLTALVWAFASSLGPPLGGILYEDASWRWIFRINLPLTFIAFVLVAVFLRLKKPQGSVVEKVKRIDWHGNLLLSASTAAITVAMTRGGVQAPWSSAQTLIPLVLGFLGLVAFFVVEAQWIVEPSVPFDLIFNWTSLSGYIGTFLHSIVLVILAFFMPVYFQACKRASPIQSGVDFFGCAFSVPPAAIVGGLAVVFMKRYLWQNYVGWLLMAVGCGLLSLLRPNSPTAEWVGFEVVVGIGLGFIFTSTKFPIMAPVSVTRNASAMALFAFSRTFAQTFGITIGSTVLQNELQRRLPADIMDLFPAGVDVAFAAIPIISQLPDAARLEVQDAFALSLSMVWKVILGFCCAGLLSVFMMKEIPLYSETDHQWDMTSEVVNEEKAAGGCAYIQSS